MKVAPTFSNITLERDFCYITPEEYIAMHKRRGSTPSMSLKEAISRAKLADKGTDECMNCDIECWQFGQCDMCFTCTTGETDPSDDFELTMNPKKKPHYKVEYDSL